MKEFNRVIGIPALIFVGVPAVHLAEDETASIAPAFGAVFLSSAFELALSRPTASAAQNHMERCTTCCGGTLQYRCR